MTQYAVSGENIWPTANDVDTTSGSGKKLLELRLSPWRAGSEQNYTISGSKVPLSSTNLDLSVPTGIHVINGYYVRIPGSTTVTSVNGTNFLYLCLTRDGNGKVTGAAFDRLSSANDVGDYLLIAMLIAAGGVITSTIDCRRYIPYAGPASGPVSTPAGTYSHEGSILFPSNGTQGGVHLYTGVRILAGVTITSNRSIFCLIADSAIEIAGTIQCATAGGTGGTANAGQGTDGTDQAGGGGGGNGSTTGANGGRALSHGVVMQQGGVGAIGTAGAATPLNGSDILWAIDCLSSLHGGAGGGGGTGANAGAGGNGGGSIVLIAPIVILKATAVLNTSAAAGNNATSGNAGGGGGGGAGNIFIKCREYTNEGATFTQTGGAGGNLSGLGGNGGNGAAGTFQILRYV